MAQFNADQAVKRYLDAIQSPQTATRYREGINNTQVNPMQLAADAEDLYLRRVQESVTSGKRKRKLLAVPVERWKNNASKKGAERIASGGKMAEDKVRQHFQTFGPTYQQASDAVKGMPKGTKAAALDRMSKVLDIMMTAAGRTT